MEYFLGQSLVKANSARIDCDLNLDQPQKIQEWGLPPEANFIVKALKSHQSRSSRRDIHEALNIGECRNEHGIQVVIINFRGRTIKVFGNGGVKIENVGEGSFLQEGNGINYLLSGTIKIAA